MTARRIAGLLALALLVAPPASAHVVSDREIVVLRALPAGMVSRLAGAAAPDSSGCVGANRGGWRSVALQQGAMLLLADGAARADSAAAERAWRSLDAAFAHQRPPGDFEAASGAAGESSAAGATLGTTVWVAETCRALIAVMNSPLQDRFRLRYALILPKLRRTLDWLDSGAAGLGRAQALHAGNLLAAAQAFLLADGIYHEPEFNRVGQQCLVAALDLQGRDGAFHCGGAIDAGQQALCLMRLQEITQYFPAPSLERAVDSAARWLQGRVGGKGEVRVGRSRASALAQRDVALALAYYAERRADDSARRAAQRAAIAWEAARSR